MKRPQIAAETFGVGFALDQFNEADYTFRGMASVFNAPIDCYPPSVIEPGAFAKTLQDQGSRVKILWQHDTCDPIGRPLSLKETAQGLELVGKLDPVPNGERAAVQMKTGTLTDLSIGFDPVRWDMVQDASGAEPVRHIKECKLWEVSIVTFGAQRSARMSMSANAFRDLSVAPLGAAWVQAEARERVEKWANGSQERLARAFLAGSGTDARFQIADVIDGKLTVVPAALFAAAYGLDRAELPERVVEYAKEHVASYYSKLGLLAPWEREVVPVAIEAAAAVPPAEGFKKRSFGAKRYKKMLEDCMSMLAALAVAEDDDDDAPAAPPAAAPEEEQAKGVAANVNADGQPSTFVNVAEAAPAADAPAPQAEEENGTGVAMNDGTTGTFINVAPAFGKREGASLVLAYNEDQPRDERGRWGDGGGGDSDDSPKKTKDGRVIGTQTKDGEKTGQKDANGNELAVGDRVSFHPEGPAYQDHKAEGKIVKGHTGKNGSTVTVEVDHVNGVKVDPHERTLDSFRVTRDGKSAKEEPHRDVVVRKDGTKVPVPVEVGPGAGLSLDIEVDLALFEVERELERLGLGK